ncbi:MAG: sodium:solute symporter [Gemmatimonadota bacterium]|uniref:sodium:solute symporter n=1 Tax=Candidatus Palauibacter scopulicola TaxID=3056741 RepID=UPI002390B697|nr:sodium:solute symporter [Candidatus Palauibacter scopulicola]MDE2663847.1 sodium:solute symporter [Candidatus Palauibacter scopulicola]
MSGLDWVVFAVYFGGVVAFAWRQSRKNRGVEGFFLANRRLGWGAIGLSVMATQASAITYIGTTGQAFDDGMEFVQFYLGQPIAMVILCVVFVPFFYRSKVFTAYEYLERRFDPRTRSLTSFLFLVSRGLSAGIVLYAPAIVLSVIMGWDERVTILVMGLITVAYTIMGGITAVIWTDVLQMIVMFAGIGIAIAVLFSTLPEGVGVGDVAYIGGIHEMWRSIDLSWDPTNRYTLWSGLIGGLFLALGYFGTDQSQVQRYLTASSLRQSRLSLIFNAFVKVPMQVFILAIGVLLYVFYHFERPPLVFNSAEATMVRESPRAGAFATLEAEHERTHELRRESTLAVLEARRSGEDPAALQGRIAGYDDELARLREASKSLVSEVRGSSSNDVNYVFPSYLISYVPAGILGLLIAVIFAAAMSSLDSELTALSSATVIDFYRRYVKPEGTDAHYLLVSRLATLGWGGFAVLFALYAGRLGSLVEAVNEVGSIFYGALLGVFLLAFLVKRATAAGAFYGLIFAMLVVLAVSRFTEIAWLWYNVVGTLAVLAVGLALRRRGPEEPAEPGVPSGSAATA